MELYQPTFETIQPIETKGKSLKEQFEEFHGLNPHVGQQLLAMARYARARGVKRIGIATLYESLRWNYAIQTIDPEGAFKLNNNYRAFYSRWIMDQDPEYLKDFFTTRQQRS